MKKNLNSVITNGILIALGVLFICFMAGSYLANDIPYSGYKLLSVVMEVFSKNYVYIIYGITTIIELVCAGLLIVLGTLNLLVALNVIKKESLARTFNKFLNIVSVIAVICVLLSLIGYVPITETADGFGWAMIANIIVLVAALVVSIYNKRASKKAATETKE